MFVNTASSIFPFTKVLSGTIRVIITATNRPTQRLITVFPEYFVKGLSDPAADLDKNGALSILELFKYSADHTSRYYSDNNHLATEFAVIEDTGDRKAFRLNELEDSNEGSLAALTYFKSRYSHLAKGVSSSSDSLTSARVKELEIIELEIAELKSVKQTYDENEYYSKLEKLMIRLTKISQQLDSLKVKE